MGEIIARAQLASLQEKGKLAMLLTVGKDLLLLFC
jgi:hypothetical protein